MEKNTKKIFDITSLHQGVRIIDQHRRELRLNFEQLLKKSYETLTPITIEALMQQLNTSYYSIIGLINNLPSSATSPLLSFLYIKERLTPIQQEAKKWAKNIMGGEMSITKFNYYWQINKILKAQWTLYLYILRFRIPNLYDKISSLINKQVSPEFEAKIKNEYPIPKTKVLNPEQGGIFDIKEVSVELRDYLTNKFSLSYENLTVLISKFYSYTNLKKTLKESPEEFIIKLDQFYDIALSYNFTCEEILALISNNPNYIIQPLEVFIYVLAFARLTNSSSEGVHDIKRLFLNYGKNKKMKFDLKLIYARLLFMQKISYPLSFNNLFKLSEKEFAELFLARDNAKSKFRIWTNEQDLSNERLKETFPLEDFQNLYSLLEDQMSDTAKEYLKASLGHH